MNPKLKKMLIEYGVGLVFATIMGVIVKVERRTTDSLKNRYCPEL